MSAETPLLILVVEPDPVARATVSLALRDVAAAVTVTAVADGPAALEALTPAPDAALVNLLLPRLSGLDTIRQLRAQLGAGRPILAASALGLKEMVQQARAAGANDFVVKPYEPARVVEKVRAALARAGRLPAGPRPDAP